MYQWWKFLHIAAAFVFVMTHGVSAAVSYRLIKERDRERIRELLTFSGSMVLPTYISLALVVVAGIFTANAIPGAGYWKQKWIWLSIGVLVVTIGVMGSLARTYYQGIKEAIGMRPSGVPRVSDADLDQRLRSPKAHVIATVGYLGLGAIVWLMVFKPR